MMGPRRPLADPRISDPPPPDLGEPSRVGWIALGTIGVSFLIFMIWAFTAPLNRGVVAQGRVDVEGRRTVVKHKDGGIIGQVIAKQGDLVKAGDTLAIMDDREARYMLQMLTQRRTQVAIEAAARKAEIARENTITWPADIAAAIADPASPAAEWARVQEQAFVARTGARRAQIASLREQRGRLDARIDGLAATDRALTRQSSLVEQEAVGLRALERQGFAPRNRVLAIERTGADVEGRIGDNRSTIAQTRIAKTEIDMQIIQADSEGMEQAARRLTELQLELAELDDRVSTQALIVERTVIRTPVSGVVLGRLAGGVGSVIQPTEPVFEVVPNDKLVVRIEVSPTDIERMTVGMNAGVRFTGLNVQTTPRLEGTVSFVGDDAQVDRENQRSFYDVRVEVSLAELRKLGNQPIRSGMPVEVFVDGGARTAWGYLMEPIVRSFDRSFKE